ncbi:MAG: hypothetical protein ABI355_02440 [Solirubrobacteraceae bacterium]
MLLRHRPPGIESRTAELREGLAHLDQSAVAVLRWLAANKVDHVVVGPVARAIRGDREARGPVAIVPAPYGRNWERLCAALVAGHAGLRTETAGHGGSPQVTQMPVKLTAEKLSRGRRWLLRCEAHDLDIEAAGSHREDARTNSYDIGPRYQELLYESGRFEIADELSVEVASPEDLEHYSHVRRTGAAPEFRITRTTHAEHETADGPTT